jgi:dinuclear metal center YbgI/SA1388 family protein
MAKIKEVAEYLESIAPKAWQESYDNCGLIVGNDNDTVSGILVSLDCTEDVVHEAIGKNYNLIVTHHPILFKPIKSLTGKNHVEKAIIMAIRHRISIYSLHTNLDNIKDGVNRKICEKIGLQNPRILSPRKNALSKLTTFVPEEDTQKVLDALYSAGAGNIGNYKNCSFRVSGTGTFMPNDLANPHIGEKNKLEEATENRVEVIFPYFLKGNILNALTKSHPYEEVAYYLHDLENTNDSVGSGMIGELAQSMKLEEFLSHLKSVFGLKVVRYTVNVKGDVSSVAVCGGAGSFLLHDAIRQGADAFISSDFKYHEFFDSEGRIAIVDMGHYESEYFTKELIHETLSKNFTNIALEISEINTNPVRYL